MIGSRVVWVYDCKAGAQYLGTSRLPKKIETSRPIVEARKLEHGFRRISARIPYTLP